MGSYLAKPVTKKESNDDSSENLSYGASSMQGWRTFQEDRHNAILNFHDEKLSFFAVYDGHGGVEVAMYASEHFPYCILQKIEEENDYTKAITEAFLEFDCKLVEPDVQQLIKEMAMGSPDQSDTYTDEVTALQEEATMPIEKLVERYAERKCDDSEGNTKASSSGLIPNSDNEKEHSCVDISSKSSGGSSKNNKLELSESLSKDNDATSHYQNEEKCQNGESYTVTKSNNTKDSEVNSDDNQGNANGDMKMGKGKGHSKGKNVLSTQEVEELKKLQGVQLRKSVVRQPTLYEKLQDSEEELTDGDSDTEDDSDIESESEDCSTDDGDDSSEELEETEGESFYSEFMQQNQEEPCYDSGCTACVAILQGKKLYVANVGDSRCVVYRNGEAVDMSVDHKPEDTIECNRIIQAGGKITDDGRVNGGLNLSRALGDHRYKLNEAIDPVEQMISPEPDIKILELTDKDSFMVIACDGIWNSMSSQEVCEFIEIHIKENCKLSSICEKLFDECLAPDATGDGTGCDNMTCIIVKFNFAKESKRKVDDSEDIINSVSETKKIKINL